MTRSSALQISSNLENLGFEVKIYDEQGGSLIVVTTSCDSRSFECSKEAAGFVDGIKYALANIKTELK